MGGMALCIDVSRPRQRILVEGVALGFVAVLGSCGGSLGSPQTRAHRSATTIYPSTTSTLGHVLGATTLPLTPPPASPPIATPTSTTTTFVPGSGPPSSAVSSQTQGCSDLVQQTRSFTYQPKQRMEVGQEYQVVVVATSSGLAAKRDFPNSTPTTILAISTACQVQVELSSLDFKIDPPGWFQQGFETSNKLTWSWTVSPMRPGSLSLTLQIQPMFLANGQPHLAAIDHETASITVTAVPEPFISSVGHWLESQFPIGLIIAAVITGLVTGWAAHRYEWRGKRRKAVAKKRVKKLRAEEQGNSERELAEPRVKVGDSERHDVEPASSAASVMVAGERPPPTASASDSPTPKSPLTG
jgi:hypothetical protein